MSDFETHLRIGTLRIRDLRDAQRYTTHDISRDDTIYDQQAAEDVILSIVEGIGIGHVTTTSKDGKTFKYITGGQRIRAILRFMADELKVTGPRTQRLRKFSEWCAEDRERFEQKKIILHSYIGLTDEQEYKLYIRSNKWQEKPSHGEFVLAGEKLAPMCELACDLSDRYHDDLKNVSRVFGSRSDKRKTSLSWTLIVLSNFHNGQVLYGRKLTWKKNEELCESYHGKPIDAEMLTERFEELMRIVRTKKTNMKYPSYVLATVQAIMLAGDDYTAEQVTDFLYDMLDRNKHGDLHTRWNTLIETPGLDANHPSSCISRAKIFKDWIDNVPIARLAPPPGMTPDPFTLEERDYHTEPNTPRVDFRAGDYIWVRSEDNPDSDEGDLAKILKVKAGGKEFDVEWWYQGIDMYKKIPGLQESVYDDRQISVYPWDLVLDNNSKTHSIDIDMIISHADEDVLFHNLDQIRSTWWKDCAHLIDKDTRQRIDLMWTDQKPGRKRQYSVIDFIPTKKMMKWSPTYDKRVYVRTKLKDKFPTWSSEEVEDLVDEMARESKDSRDFACRLNTCLNWEEA